MTSERVESDFFIAEYSVLIAEYSVLIGTNMWLVGEKDTEKVGG